MNDRQTISVADTHQSNYIKRRDISEDSCPYRPTHIDVNPQHQTFLSFSRSFNNSSPLNNNSSFDGNSPFNNNSPLEFDHNKNIRQGLEPIEELNMPLDPSGKFVMNPKASVFVPREQPGMHPLAGIDSKGQI